jgi:hypothetical protein
VGQTATAAFIATRLVAGVYNVSVNRTRTHMASHPQGVEQSLVSAGDGTPISACQY